MAPLVTASAFGDQGGEPLLVEALDWLESPRTPVRDRDVAWAAGDLQPFTRDVTDFQRVAPGLYEIAFTLRARAWTSVLVGMMGTEAQVVVFVPADALVGEHGLPNLLRQAGYTVEGP